VIRWQDFRDFVGVYSEPTIEPDPTGGVPHEVPDLAFDAAQYRAELDRASADRSWETKRRRLARLLRAQLIAREEELVARGYTVGWVAPGWEREQDVNVELRVPNGQLVLQLDADLRLPERDAVDQLTSAVLDRAEDEWHVLERNDWPRDDC
jgi:hypothetical protein